SVELTGTATRSTSSSKSAPRSPVIVDEPFFRVIQARCTGHTEKRHGVSGRGVCVVVRRAGR
ncbi:hypothetical protein, partial [Paraburkholderia dinghuensis]|uniref:hypothetical protein n=1 Tax=Paraburkholderia dinghuensis TaxID=2305225 RepID=UPI001C877D3B